MGTSDREFTVELVDFLQELLAIGALFPHLDELIRSIRHKMFEAWTSLTFRSIGQGLSKFVNIDGKRGGVGRGYSQ